MSLLYLFFILTVLLYCFLIFLSSPLLSSPLLSSRFLLCFYGNLYNPAAQFCVFTTKYQRRETTLQFNLKLASAKRKSHSCKREAWCVTKLYDCFCGGSYYNSCLQDHISHDDTYTDSQGENITSRCNHDWMSFIFNITSGTKNTICAAVVDFRNVWNLENANKTF